ncbi:MAG: winged helix-turn-helix transcriptional regulator, partial [Actinomycetota bacterium]
GELASDVAGIAPNILTSRLRHLEREGILISRPYSRKPVRMAYELTASGRELAGALKLLALGAAGHAAGATGPAHSECGTPMEARWYCPTCARVVDDREASDDIRYV